MTTLLLSASDSAKTPLRSLSGIFTTSQSSDSTITASLADEPDSSFNESKLIHREYNHKQQIILGVGMMVFIAVIFSTVQSWNP